MAGFPPIFSFLATGFQGIIGRGMQRPGTKTGTGPIIFQFMGLMGDMQFPKAGIFNMGMISNWPASDLILELKTLAIGSTIIFFGPAPKVHFNLAPMHTHLGICFFGFWMEEEQLIVSSSLKVSGYLFNCKEA